MQFARPDKIVMRTTQHRMDFPFFIVGFAHAI